MDKRAFDSFAGNGFTGFDNPSYATNNAVNVRDCEEKQIPSDELVVGDIVIIR
uniref:Uncharacterized protein n=1 Tax=Meloidogyne enterolobii TaxID=390850 RepID=A0A6V7UM27_MELEN|nr:unnamed protein product [Meloidogyne enterolobii]